WTIGDTPKFNTSAVIYDGDLDSGFNIKTAHNSAKKFTVCYINVGSLELDSGLRPDYNDFPDSVLGNQYPGWNEKFIDIRSPIVRNLMTARIQRAADAGCDAVEPDNTMLLGFNTGFPLTESDILDYLTFLSNQTHSSNMAIALKNNGDLLQKYKSQILSMTDFAIVEGCYKLNGCNLYTPFIDASKPVLATEYTDPGKDGGCDAITADQVDAACGVLNDKGYEGIVKNCNLGQELYRSCQSYNSDGVRAVNGVMPAASAGTGGKKNGGVGFGVVVVLTVGLVWISRAIY
ncbi:hypothetical protein HDU76_006519, partial [Blyttiomyces sp. JEL0837]